MKLLIALTSITMTCFASAANNPDCYRTSSRPCVVSKAEEDSNLTMMMLENRAGMSKIFKTIKNGIRVDSSRNNPVTIKFFGEDNSGNVTTFRARYEIYIASSDDAESGYLWVVKSKTEADGYYSYTKYKNSLKKLQIKP